MCSFSNIMSFVLIVSEVQKREYICRFCTKPCVHVGKSVRIPKRTDVKEWKLLELLLLKKTFEKSKFSTLASFWYKHKWFMMHNALFKRI